MLMNNNTTKAVKSNSLKTFLLLITAILFSLTQVTANELNPGQFTVSKGVLKKSINDQERKTIIENSKTSEISDQISGIASAKTRESILNNTKIKTLKSKNSKIVQKTNSDYYADFSIYSAISFLHDDYDGDGFYQTFSVTFDADIYSYTDNQFGEVYALLYLSKNGGPWTHYFTTDNFLIEGESDLDEYEVTSTFMSGYETDHYDVLIDLYQVGYSDIVASLSSDDNNALYALPIESAEYDEQYIEFVEVEGGSIYWLLLILLSFVLIRNKA